jgi:hypothetical protein
MTTVDKLAALGTADASKPFDLEIDGVAIRVRPEGEDNEDVALVAPYAGRAAAGDYRGEGAPRLSGPRPMMITLTRESDADRQAKRRGVSREVQTGDAAFDELVYVTTESGDELVKAVLGSEVRGAACTLLRAGFHEIIIDDEGARITASCRGTCLADADAIARAFATIVSHVPEVQVSRLRRFRSWPGAVGFGLIVTVPVVVACALLAVSWYWVPVATVAGGAAGAVCGLAIGRTQRGRSDSHVRRQILAGASLLVGVLAGNFVALYVLDERAWIVYAAAASAVAIVGGMFAIRD